MAGLLENLSEKKAIVGIIGLGYVGLPLAKIVCKAGYTVVGVDLDKSKVEKLNLGRSYIKHFPSQAVEQMKQDGKFRATTSFDELAQVDVIIICVPTPLTKNREPNLEYILNAGKEISNVLKKGQLVILESSSFPGTTDEELGKVLESSGLQRNEDFYLAYSPEREDPGNTLYGTASIPKVVGASAPKALKLAETFYAQVVDSVIPVSDSKTAEAVKITENIFRSVNIALVNELKIVFDKMGIDIWEVVNAAATKPFGYMPFYPGPGLGGHCIPIDPFYLSFKAKEFDIATRFIELAGEINRAMPGYVVEKVSLALNDHSQKSINGSEILIVGVAYKKDIDDMRESPAVEISKILAKRGGLISYHDSFTPNVENDPYYGPLAGLSSIDLTPESLVNIDLVLICTNHTVIDYQLLGDVAPVIVDTRNAMDSLSVKASIVKA